MGLKKTLSRPSESLLVVSSAENKRTAGASAGQGGRAKPASGRPAEPASARLASVAVGQGGGASIGQGYGASVGQGRLCVGIRVEYLTYDCMFKS